MLSRIRATRSRTWLTAALVCCVVVAVVVLCYADPSNVGWFVLVLVAGWLSLNGTLVRALVVELVAVALYLSQALVTPDPGWYAWIAGTTVAVLGGLLVRRERLLAEELRAAQAGLEDRARLAERARMAAEMHDLVGHTLTVTLLHISSARLAVRDGSGDAEAALLEAERLGQAALAEVRQTVRSMRDPDQHLEPPLPSYADLVGLVETFGAAGADVELACDVEPSALTGSSVASLHRILQEALTNGVRHGQGALRVSLVNVAHDRVRLTVDSEGTRATSAGSSAPSGLHIMRERAEALGGELVAGATATGWRVVATVPARHGAAADGVGR